eukprot:1010542-Lingulodinium_polyedra.AAC.1
MVAASARASVRSLWATWGLFHREWFGPAVPILPLTQEKILAVAACFKEGGYKGFPSYVSKAKEHHVLSGYGWDEELAVATRKVTASVLRGLGGGRQSAPFDLALAIEAAQSGQVQLPADGPVGWQHLLVVGTFFIMREIEIAFAQVEHVAISPGDKKVHLQLPVSKKDPRAL